MDEDFEGALDDIRAACIAAGIPEETTTDTGTVIRWSTPALVDRMAADLAEARAEIAALRGLPEGAVSEGWTWDDDGGFWEKRGQHFAITISVHADEVRWYLARRGNPTNEAAPTLRAAMRAADKAAGVGS